MSAQPGYVELARKGLLSERVTALSSLLRSCTACPRMCEVDRAQKVGECATPASPVVSSWTPHFGEEPIISGNRGSGTVFLSNCNLRCAFCQNSDISQRPAQQPRSETSVESLASIFVELQDRGCHNINWVSPTHQLPQLSQALEIAERRGLSLPIVYNSNAYDSVEALKLLDEVVDVYMPDLKYSETEAGETYSQASEYPKHARAAVAEMFRQVGDNWELDAGGVLRRGLLVRLLVLPNDLAGIEESLQWISETLSPRVGISLMAQYYPAHKARDANRYPLLSRPISSGEWGRALDALERWMEGDHHYVQDQRTAPHYYRPDFSDSEVPFTDIKDFE